MDRREKCRDHTNKCSNDQCQSRDTYIYSYDEARELWQCRNCMHYWSQEQMYIPDTDDYIEDLQDQRAPLSDRAKEIFDEEIFDPIIAATIEIESYHQNRG